MFHYNQVSGDSIDRAGAISSAYYPSRCVMRLLRDPAAFLKVTWIRPEDMQAYTDAGIRYFKLQGRQTVMDGDPLRAVTAYADGRFEGDFKDLLFLFAPSPAFQAGIDNRKLDGFLRRVGIPWLHQTCGVCDYCGAFAARLTDPKAAGPAMKAALNAMEAKDAFRGMVRAVRDRRRTAGEARTE